MKKSRLPIVFLEVHKKKLSLLIAYQEITTLQYTLIVKCGFMVRFSSRPYFNNNNQFLLEPLKFNTRPSVKNCFTVKIEFVICWLLRAKISHEPSRQLRIKAEIIQSFSVTPCHLAKLRHFNSYTLDHISRPFKESYIQIGTAA